MLPLFKKLIKPKSGDKDKLFSDIQQISVLSDKANGAKKQLEDAEYKILTEQKDEVYLSLGDFLELMESPGITISDIISKCKHACELQEDISAVELYSFVDGSHIVLCKDIKSCEEHEDYTGDKIRIVTARRVQ